MVMPDSPVKLVSEVSTIVSVFSVLNSVIAS